MKNGVKFYANFKHPNKVLYIKIKKRKSLGSFFRKIKPTTLSLIRLSLKL